MNRKLQILFAVAMLTALVMCFRPRPTPAPADKPGDGGNQTYRIAQVSTRPLLALPSAAPVEVPPTNLASRLLDESNWPDLQPEQLTEYLKANHRNAESLLSAFRTTHDKHFLEEAKEKFPNDPRVDFEAAWRSGTPEEKRRWLDALKASAPDNAFGPYLSASDYFQSAQPEKALADVAAAAGMPLQDYSFDFIQSTEEAYRAAGYSDAEAKARATRELLIPQMAEYKKVGVNLIDLAGSYRQSGDEASAQSALQMAMDLGQRLQDAGSLALIQDLVGMAIQKRALMVMDPNAPFGSAGQTVQNQLDAINQHRQQITQSVRQFETIQPTLSDQDLGSYMDRRLFFGEQAAMQWVVDKYAKPGTTPAP